MVKMNKKTKSAQDVRQWQSIFKCPVCGSPMKVIELKSLICSNYHTFDFTRQGYLNLTTHPAKNKYSRELFEARRKMVAEEGFFVPLSYSIVEVINEHVMQNPNGKIAMIDIGCGEGSHLSHICDILSPQYERTVTGVGIDIAKEGILMASRDYTDKTWVVADLANLPFKAKSFDVILNILSPLNYAEFARLMKDEGLVVKVVPQKDYLKELRESFFDYPEKQTYSNTETVERFKDHFQVIDHSRLRYTMNVSQTSIQSLLRMTPLTWSATKEQMQPFLIKSSTQITVDLDLLVGIKAISH